MATRKRVMPKQYPCYEMYKDVANQWRWKYIAANYKIIAVSSESYWNEADCLASIHIMQASWNSPIYKP